MTEGIIDTCTKLYRLEKETKQIVSNFTRENIIFRENFINLYIEIEEFDDFVRDNILKNS